MKIGYVRISTKEQNTARQDVLMEGVEVEKVYTDKMSGKDTNRPELEKMMDFVREGDIVIAEFFLVLQETQGTYWISQCQSRAQTSLSCIRNLFADLKSSPEPILYVQCPHPYINPADLL